MAEFKRRRSKPLRFMRVPLPDDHPDWLELDRQVPADHLARRLRALVEQLDLSPLLETYTGVGGAICPPDLLLAFVLFETHRGHLSPAEWFTDSRESIPARWLLRGFRPCRSVFYRFPDHLPEGLLDDLNAQVLLPARSEGFTTAQHGALDGTFTAAYGSRHRLLTCSALEHRLQLLHQAVTADGNAAGLPSPPAAPPLDAGQPARLCPAAPAQAPPCPPPVPEATPQQPPAAAAAAAGQPYWMAGTKAGRLRQHQAYSLARQTLKGWQSEHEHRQKDKAKSRRRSALGLVVCPTEPEAVLGRDKCKVFRPLYNTQVMQDTGSPFVLGYGVYARVTDSGLLPPMLERTQRLTGQKLAGVTTDGIYARLKDVRYCKDNGVQLYAPVGAQARGQKRKGQGGDRGGKGGAKKEEKYGKEKFSWQQQPRGYRCPEGHLLQLGRIKHKAREEEEVEVEEYRCDKQKCMKCPQASRCTSRPQTGRTVDRMVGQELLDEVAARMSTQQGKEQYKKRKQTVEPRHGDMRKHRGLQQVHGYGLARARSQVGVMVLVNNGLALLQARQRRAAAKAADAKVEAEPAAPGQARALPVCPPCPAVPAQPATAAHPLHPPPPAPPRLRPSPSDTAWLGFN